MNEKLKPCPFCGGELTIEEGDDCYLVCCETCDYHLYTGSQGVGWWGCREDAVKDANRRPIEEGQAVRIAELEAENGRLRKGLQEIAEWDMLAHSTKGLIAIVGVLRDKAYEALKKSR